MMITDCPLCKKFGNTLLCPICKGIGKVNGRTSAEKKKRKNDKSRRAATNSGKPFTKYEILLLQNPEYSTPTLAKRLERSIKSIENMRYRLKKGAGNG